MNKRSEVLGWYPKRVIRAFDEERYALDLIDHGKFRLGANTFYRKIESATKKDGNEGTGKFRYLGTRRVRIESLDPNVPTSWSEEEGEFEVTIGHGSPVYLLCCTLSPNTTLIEKRFGKNKVEIQNPRRLAELIEDYFQSKSMAFYVLGKKVAYDRDELFVRDPGPLESAELAYTQKSPRFIDDEEFRYCALSKGPANLWLNNPPDHIYIDLNQTLSAICKLVKD